MTASAESGCGSLFAELVLLEYRPSSVDFAYLAHTEWSWAEVDDLNTSSGCDRACLLTDPAAPVTGTLARATR